MKSEANEHAGSKYYINIEGSEYLWDKDTISVQEIRTLGNIPADQAIVQENPDGTEVTLAENQIIELQPGHRYGRAAKYRRG
jgi:hypothetical protein